MAVKFIHFRFKPLEDLDDALIIHYTYITPLDSEFLELLDYIGLILINSGFYADLV